MSIGRQTKTIPFPNEQEMAELRAEHYMKVEEVLAAALTEAIELIRSYHGDPGWAEYQQSPEMTRLHAALAKATPK